MNRESKRHCGKQSFIDVSDRLAAFRSALEWIYVVIAAALIFTCVFHSLYEVGEVTQVDVRGCETVSVLIRKRNWHFDRGDTVLVRSGREIVCVSVTEIQQDDSGKVTGFWAYSGSGLSRMYPMEQVMGKVDCVLFPSICFGDRAEKVSGGRYLGG